MKKRLTILTCLMLVCTFMFGQSSIWGDIVKSPDGMTANARIVVKIGGETQTSENFEVGALCGDELRAFGKIEYRFGQYMSLLSLNGTTGDVLTFKVYDKVAQIEYVSDFTWTYSVNGQLGSAGNPQVINFATPSVAEVNGVGYQTLAEAYAAATNGETITLIRDITDATTIVKPTHNIVIDGNGKTVSGGMSFGSDDNKLDNVNINISNVNFVGEGLSVKELANVTVENNTFANITKGNGITVICDNLTETVNVVGNTVTDVVAGTGIRIRNAKEANVNGNTVKNIFSNAILLEGKTYGDVTVTNNLVENWGVAGEGRAIRIVKGANTTVAVNGNAMLHENAPEEFVKVSSNTANVNIDENYWNGENPVEEKLFSDNNNNNNVCPANYYRGYETIGTSWSLTNRVDLNYVAKAGDVYYESLAEAYAAATSTVYLLRDAEGAGIVINKDVTINFNGHAYTFSELGVGSGTLTSNGFQILKGNNVTLKNGTLNVAEAMKAEYYILIQNYANLNVENMNLDGTNLDKWSTVATDLDSYVLSNNSGNVNIVNTTITANDEGAKAFAFDVCKKASYEAPVVTLDAESTINGRVELSGGQFYPEQGVKVSLTKEIDPYDLENESGWYTISAPFATESINIVGDYTLFRYDEKTAVWENHKKHNFGIEVGRGYLYANLQGNDLTLEGLANVDTYQTTLKYESEVDELKGNHLLGNPYTFDITGKHLAGSIAGGFYQMAGNGAWVASELTEEIAVGEGFLVQANEEASFVINKTATETRSADNGSLQINVANDVYSDVAYVSFNEGVGLSKISHQNANIPMVYVPVENNDYAIAYLGENVEEVPFSFEAKTMGTYTIGVKAQNCEFSTMTLVDRFTGVETNLLLEDYSFVAKSSDNSDRFILKLSRGTTNLEEEHFAYITNNGLIINNASGNATLQIFDVMGRPVSSHNVSGNANIAMESLTNGVYILRLIDDNNVRIQKVVID